MSLLWDDDLPKADLIEYDGEQNQTNHSMDENEELKMTKFYISGNELNLWYKKHALPNSQIENKNWHIEFLPQALDMLK